MPGTYSESVSEFRITRIIQQSQNSIVQNVMSDQGVDAYEIIDSTTTPDSRYKLHLVKMIKTMPFERMVGYATSVKKEDIELLDNMPEEMVTVCRPDQNVFSDFPNFSADNLISIHRVNHDLFQSFVEENVEEDDQVSVTHYNIVIVNGNAATMRHQW